jgi:hypothetical protein
MEKQRRSLKKLKENNKSMYKKIVDWILRNSQLLTVLVNITLVLVNIGLVYVTYISANWEREYFNIETYLIYPHFGIDAICPQYVGVYHPERKITLFIENYGKYAASVRLNVKIEGNLNYSIEGPTSFILPGGKQATNGVILYPDYTKTEEFNVTIEYFCQGIEAPCDFWPARGISCMYRPVRYQGRITDWKLVNSSYIAGG